MFKYQKPITDYKHIKYLYQITISNGQELSSFLNAVYKNKGKIQEMEPEKILLEGNRLIANYCSFIGMLIDQIEKVLTKRGKQKITDFRNMCSQLYDEKFEYRFIVLLRNFITHYSLPFVHYSEDFNGKRIEFSKNHLLKFSKWKHVKNELEQMKDYIDFREYINPMNVNLTVLFYTLIFHLSSDIVNAYQKMSDFILKHRIKSPAIARYNSVEECKQGKMSYTPIEVKDLISAFKDVKSHPKINLEINDITPEWLISK
ncbi:hypothetical protein [Oceanobacillus oncorhynchi]|uniref:hypothetical protein n=1 Tax=Oceanobacillus oncorhynchi TaxID=545501 RepID=UPI0034D6F110